MSHFVTKPFISDRIVSMFGQLQYQIELIIFNYWSFWDRWT